MDPSQVQIYRTPHNKQNQIFIFNSSIDYTDQQLIVYQRPGLVPGDAGYCIVYKRDHYIINSLPNYQSPTKRSFLNECIRQLYLINGLAHKLHWAPSITISSRRELWQQVDYCLQSSYMSPKQRVKRQLFREDRATRKQAHTARSRICGTQVLNFRPMRCKIERKHIRRGYLKAARQVVIEQLIHENFKREMRSTSCLIGPQKSRLAATERNAKPTESAVLKEQMRRAVHNHNIILEESVRSMLYARELFKLLQDESFPIIGLG